MPIDLIAVVWGSEYVALFLNVIVPNYLSPGNLPQIVKNHEVRFRLFTTQQDAAVIERHRSWERLQAICRMEILPVIDQTLLSAKNKWSVKGFCQSLALKEAIQLKRIVAFLNPDSLISDGGLARCISWIEKGKKAVLIPELARAEIESMVPELLKRFYDEKEHVLNLSNRTLVGLGVEHLHDIGKIFFWDANPISKWSSVLYWKVGKNSLLAKFFHLHPILIDLRAIVKTIPDLLMPDGAGLIEYLGIKPSEVYAMTDSEEVAFVELSSKFMQPGGCLPHQPYSKSLAVLKWALSASSPQHRRQFLQWNIHYQGDEDIDWAKWETKAKSDLSYVNLGLRLFNLMPKERIRSIAKRLGLLYIRNKIRSYVRN